MHIKTLLSLFLTLLLAHNACAQIPQDALPSFNRAWQAQQQVEEEEILNDEPLARFTEDAGKFAIKNISTLVENEDIVLKEQQFLCFMPANEMIESKENQKILVQGVADLIIIKKDEIWLIDYKTSRLKNKKDFEKKYGTQLKIYAKAIQNFYEKPVTKKMIYSFYLNKLLTI